MIIANRRTQPQHNQLQSPQTSLKGTFIEENGVIKAKNNYTW